jgi:hypothetical protein
LPVNLSLLTGGGGVLSREALGDVPVWPGLAAAGLVTVAVEVVAVGVVAVGVVA